MSNIKPNKKLAISNINNKDGLELCYLSIDDLLNFKNAMKNLLKNKRPQRINDIYSKLYLKSNGMLFKKKLNLTIHNILKSSKSFNQLRKFKRNEVLDLNVLSCLNDEVIIFKNRDSRNKELTQLSCTFNLTNELDCAPVASDCNIDKIILGDKFEEKLSKSSDL